MASADMVSDDGSLTEAGAPRQVMPPFKLSLQRELPRLHKELGLWMAHTRYQLKPVDQQPIYRVQNTTMTLSTGTGIGTYYIMKRLRPSMRFPIDIIPPFVAFYLTHRAAQAWQMPGLYESLLSAPSPLGERAREILHSLRHGGRLPSDEFGTQLPQQMRPAPGAGGAGEASTDAFGFDAAPAPAPAAGSSGAPAAADAASADAWAQGDSIDNLAGTPAWTGPVEGADAPPKPARTTTWDEIRARSAAGAPAQFSSPSGGERARWAS
eukprot:TRINITY_DN31912_c0_g1_i1.p1 TRINITY_DN31912_c0_g1~~TRINITY_DN31912_c0_g1_i1.p1  ORF type:complete len:267 (+),score=50.92 TRINITY_DN31912_c0_g1_i1:95-895(+)